MNKIKYGYYWLLVLVASAAIMISGCGKSADSLYNEGKKLVLEEKSFEEGVELLERFERKFPNDPRYPEIVLALATIYQSTNQFELAEKTYIKIGEKYPSSPEAEKGLFLLGYMFYEDVKDAARAESVFAEFLEKYPESELVSSARILVENIHLPIDEWPVIRDMQPAWEN